MQPQRKKSTVREFSKPFLGSIAQSQPRPAPYSSQQHPQNQNAMQPRPSDNRPLTYPTHPSTNYPTKKLTSKPPVPTQSSTSYASSIPAQPSTNYAPPMSAQPSTNYAPPMSAQSSANYVPPMSAQSSANYAPPMSAQPSTNYAPPMSAQPSTNYAPPMSAQSSANYMQQPSEEHYYDTRSYYQQQFSPPLAEQWSGYLKVSDPFENYDSYNHAIKDTWSTPHAYDKAYHNSKFQNYHEPTYSTSPYATQPMQSPLHATQPIMQSPYATQPMPSSPYAPPSINLSKSVPFTAQPQAFSAPPTTSYKSKQRQRQMEDPWNQASPSSLKEFPSSPKGIDIPQSAAFNQQSSWIEDNSGADFNFGSDEDLDWGEESEVLDWNSSSTFNDAEPLKHPELYGLVQEILDHEEHHDAVPSSWFDNPTSSFSSSSNDNWFDLQDDLIEPFQNNNNLSNSSFFKQSSHESDPFGVDFSFNHEPERKSKDRPFDFEDAWG